MFLLLFQRGVGVLFCFFATDFVLRLLIATCIGFMPTIVIDREVKPASVTLASVQQGSTRKSIFVPVDLVLVH